MDPTACWREIISHRNIEDAAPYVVALAGWLDYGGFEPQGFDPHRFNHMIEQIRRMPNDVLGQSKR